MVVLKGYVVFGGAKKLSGGRGKAALGLVAILAVLFAAAPASASAATYSVSPSGNDSSPGTAVLPFRTITRAAQSATSGDSVLVDSGRLHGNCLSDGENSGATFRGVGKRGLSSTARTCAPAVSTTTGLTD